MSTPLNVKQVKEQLPDVPVKLACGKRYMAKLSGRLMPDATVTISYIYHAAPRSHLRGKPWADCHFSWEAVTHAVNSGEPLAFDS